MGREVGSRNTVSGGGLTPARPLSQDHLLSAGELHLDLLLAVMASSLLAMVMNPNPLLPRSL